MRTVKIRLAQKDKANGPVELARRVKVICLPESEYLIAEAKLSPLDQLGMTYKVAGTEGFDSAIRKVRNPASAKV